MIAHTDQAVKGMLEDRFGMAAIWTGETVALMVEADMRFKFPSKVNDFITNGGEVKFPFCAYIRSPGSMDDQKYNLGMATSGVMRGYMSDDKTKVQVVKMIPVTYPYAVKYYCSDVYESIRLEKHYYGLKADPFLDRYMEKGFPDDFNSNFASFKIYITTLDGFEPPITDGLYDQGKFYTGNMGFTVSTWVAENAEIPIIQEVRANLYNEVPANYLENIIAKDRYYK